MGTWRFSGIRRNFISAEVREQGRGTEWTRSKAKRDESHHTEPKNSANALFVREERIEESE